MFSDQISKCWSTDADRENAFDDNDSSKENFERIKAERAWLRKKYDFVN